MLYAHPDSAGKTIRGLDFLNRMQTRAVSFDYMSRQERTAIRKAQTFLGDMDFDEYRQLELEFANPNLEGKSVDYLIMIPVIRDFVRRN